jgi:ABC-type sugar transport system ATPase subunit
MEKPVDAFELGIVTLYQDLALVNCRSIANNIFLGQELTKFGVFVDQKRMLDESRELVEGLGQVNIASVKTEVEKLSGGQRQAVAISRIVHRGGRVILLDEPTAALGVREAHEILNLIKSLKSNDRAIVIVSHNLAHVFRISDRITVLRGGKRVGTRMHADTDPDAIVKMITGADLL